MSPWGRWILERISVDGRGVFHDWTVIYKASKLWPGALGYWREVVVLSGR
jgi:hypothetical protein